MQLSHLICVIALLAFLEGCTKYDGKLTLDDVTKLTRVTLRAPNPNASIVGIKIVGRGRLDGTGRIFLVVNGKPYRTEELEGNIRFSWGGDWYSPSAELQYEPRDAKGGEIELRYAFREQ